MLAFLLAFVGAYSLSRENILTLSATGYYDSGRSGCLAGLVDTDCTQISSLGPRCTILTAQGLNQPAFDEGCYIPLYKWLP